MRRLATVVAAACLSAAGAASVQAHPSGHAPPRAGHEGRAAQTPAAQTTLERTITGADPDLGFSFLSPGPGDARLVREELAAAQAGREQRRRSLLYLAQLTDFQLSDEESPARVEFADDAIGPVTSSAWRPQEALVAHQVEYTIRQVNRFLDSPVTQGDGTRARLANAVLTGDLADNQQLNETEWVVRLLEGGTLEPNSGSADPAAFGGLGCPLAADPRRADLMAEAPNYTGVQDYDDYARTPIFWDPDDPAGVYETRDFPVWEGLMDRAQDAFPAEGLAVPSYVAFGNHDIQAQGNEDANAAFEDVATGCLKPLAQVPGTTMPLESLDPGFLNANPASAMLVPPDPRRRYVDRPQFKAAHDTGEQADAHGFDFIDADELTASRGDASYYSFAPKPGVRYIVIDTVADSDNTADASGGNIDDPQWQWLIGELEEATERDELVLLFGHHATGSMTVSTPDEVSVPCTVADEHGHDVNPGCDLDPRVSVPLHLGDELTALLHEHPGVVGYVAGHSHEARVAPKAREGGGGFWEIKSPAIVDWPPQHRLVELMDNEDGTLSIFGTLLDHASPVGAPPAGPADGQGGAAPLTPEQLASVGRTVTYNDPQAGPGRGDEIGPEGAATDRNVELLVPDPRRQVPDTAPVADQPAPTRRRDQDRDRDRRDRDRDAGGGDGVGNGADAAVTAGDLPFTGYALAGVALLGLLLTGTGLVARRRSGG